jgi:hypothetical protein
VKTALAIQKPNQFNHLGLFIKSLFPVYTSKMAAHIFNAREDPWNEVAGLKKKIE